MNVEDLFWKDKNLYQNLVSNTQKGSKMQQSLKDTIM